MRETKLETTGETGIEALTNHTAGQGPSLGPRPGPGNGARTRALVVGPYLSERSLPRAEKAQRAGAKAHSAPALVRRSAEARIDEASGLAAAIDLDIVAAKIVALAEIRPASFLGKGKVEEIAEFVRAEEIGLVIMDCALSPVQQRNLEKAFAAKVIDRTGLDPGDFRTPGANARRRACRSNSPISPIRNRGLSAPGPILSASAAASASLADPARPRSRPTAA